MWALYTMHNYIVRSSQLWCACSWLIQGCRFFLYFLWWIWKLLWINLNLMFIFICIISKEKKMKLLNKNRHFQYLFFIWQTLLKKKKIALCGTFSFFSSVNFLDILFNIQLYILLSESGLIGDHKFNLYVLGLNSRVRLLLKIL